MVNVKDSSMMLSVEEEQVLLNISILFSRFINNTIQTPFYLLSGRENDEWLFRGMYIVT